MPARVSVRADEVFEEPQALGSYVPVEHLAFPALLIANESVVGPTVPHTIATPSFDAADLVSERT